MKIFSSRLTIFIALLTTVFIISACDKDKATENTMYTLRGNANGAQEVPNRVNTTAAGTITGTYNRSNNVMQYTITWNGISGNPTGMHFHGPDDPGESHPNNIQRHITGFPAATSGSISRSDTLTDVHETEMLQGKWYYNIHTQANPAGEIRGQVFAIKD